MKFAFDFDNKIQKIKKMHGVGQAPIMGLNDELFHYIGDAGIPYSRLHDVGGAYGGNIFVDIHNIFRDFDADVDDEASYDFVFTDWLLEKLAENNCEPIFRLGETIENYHYVKAYRIFPPKDNLKWAKICEHIIMHYNEGWANGFHMGIEYWEIWNEPDNGRDDMENQMWHGTPEQFYELYSVAAKHLKKVFGNKIKVGGYATCGFRHILSNPQKYGMDFEKVDDECYSSGRSANFLKFFEGFFEYIKKENAPIDFFSWHSYLSTERTVLCSKYVERRLNELGYGHLETQLNEWNNVCEDRGDPTVALDIAKSQYGTNMAAAKTASMMCAMQKTKTKLLCYYDAGIGISYYMGMFNPLTREPFPLYYSFKAFNELFKLENQVFCSEEDKDGIYSLAAGNENGKAVMIVNISDADREITTNLPSDMKAYIIGEGKLLEEIEYNPQKFVIKSGCTLLFKN